MSKSFLEESKKRFNENLVTSNGITIHWKFHGRKSIQFQTDEVKRFIASEIQRFADEAIVRIKGQEYANPDEEKRLKRLT